MGDGDLHANGARWAVIDVGGLPVHYITAGAGFPLVLVHGDGGSPDDWSWVLPSLAERYRVYAPDLPGSGRTPPWPDGYAPENLTQFVAGFLDALSLQRAALVGHSAGGLLALSLALQQPERVAALVLMDSSGFGRLLNPATAAQGLPGAGILLDLWAKTPWGAAQITGARALLEFAFPWQIPSGWFAEQARLDRTPGFYEATSAIVRHDLCFGLQRVVLLDQLPRLTMPVQILWGALDRVVPVYQAYSAARNLPRAHLDVILAAGHNPQVEQPAQVLAALLPFLQEAVAAA